MKKKKNSNTNSTKWKIDNDEKFYKIGNGKKMKLILKNLGKNSEKSFGKIPENREKSVKILEKFRKIGTKSVKL